MTVLKVLAKVICTKELLRLVTFTKFVLISEVCSTRIPVRLGFIWKLIAAVATDVEGCNLIGSRWGRLRGRSIVGWCNSGGRIECIVVITFESGTRPVLLPKVNGILVTLCFILVLESISAEVTRVLFL